MNKTIKVKVTREELLKQMKPGGILYTENPGMSPFPEEIEVQATPLEEPVLFGYSPEEKKNYAEHIRDRERWHDDCSKECPRSTLHKSPQKTELPEKP